MVQSYFILSRSIFESAIWRHSVHVLKLFIYLLGAARHSNIPKRYPTVIIQRGELVTSLQQIVDENEYMQNGRLKKWSRQKVGRMLIILENEGYIKCIKDTYGTHIKIINYNIYQDPSTYRADTYGTVVEQVGDEAGTAMGRNNNVNTDKNVINGKNRSNRNPRLTPPAKTDLVKYMSDKTVMNNLSLQDAEVEAEKFMNHYDSNGWLIGGKSPMKDWKASARNWLLNMKLSHHTQAYKNPGEDQYKDL